MRNKEDKKCKKGQESIIGKIIYGFLLFMPLFAIGVTCLTTLWNKNITADNEVATIEYKYKTNDVNSAKDLIPGNIYKYSVNLDDLNVGDFAICKGFYNLENVADTYIDLSSPSYIYLYKNNATTISVYSTGPYTAIATISNISGIIEFNIIYHYLQNNDSYLNYSISDFNLIENVNITTEPTEFDTKNVFYYAVDKVTESPLFSWAQNSIVYTTLNSTCNALSITTPFIPLLFAYWLIISIIYFLYDIALMLVWMIHNKIHELQESF